jgi:basic membrane lipoprotein Med (substrate-binding protein (PBP1-ABC) superfamily)
MTRMKMGTNTLFTLIAVLAFTHFAHADIFDTAGYYDTGGGEYMAVMTSGDIDDFGYNYIINEGRVKMESMRNMSNTLWVPNIKNNVSAIAKARELVQKGFRVIVSGTFSHGNAMTVSARAYPNVTFTQYSTVRTNKTAIPNLSSCGWLNPEWWFAIGVFAAATSQNEKIGFIHPGINGEGSIQSINAFYAGVKWVNASYDVYTMFTGSYLDVDRETGACDYLVKEIGVGFLTGQQDDLTIPIYAMNAGLLAIGVSGFSLRTLYGELVGVSFVRNWNEALANISVAVNGTVYYGDIIGSFRTTGNRIDAFSYLVTQEQRNKVLEAMTLLSGPQQLTLYLCNNTFPLWNLTNQGCAVTADFNNKLYPGVKNQGYYTVPITDKPFPENTRLGIVVTSAILLALPIILAILVIVMRNNPEIQAGSPFFFLIMLAGCAIVYIGTIVWPLDPSEGNCFARVWLPSLGATIAISALITKNLRIFLLFFNPFKWRGEKLHLKNFLPIVVIFVALDIMILAIYTAKGPKGVEVQQGRMGLGTYETRHVCATSDTGNSIIYALLAFHMLQLVIGCIVSFLLRNVTSSEFNERKSVAMAIYVTTFCLIIVAILIGATDISNEQLVVFISIALLICNTGVIFLIFGSRIVNLLMGEVDPVAFATKTTSTSATMKSSGKSSDNDSGVVTSRQVAVA